MCISSNEYSKKNYKTDFIKLMKRNEAMIRASQKAKLTKQQLLDVLTEDGLMDVYNLGMKHMYDYLENNNE